MSIKTLFLAGAALLNLVSAIPRDPLIAARDTHRVVEVAHGKKPSGAQALEAAYEKYGWPVPTPIAQSALQTGSVTAADQPNDKAYYAQVTVGNENFLLNMDSGSSDLW